MSVNIDDRVEQPDGNKSSELTTDLDPAFNTEQEAQMFSTFTVNQKHAADEILSAVRERRPACIFVDGYDFAIRHSQHHYKMPPDRLGNTHQRIHVQWSKPYHPPKTTAGRAMENHVRRLTFIQTYFNAMG